MRMAFGLWPVACLDVQDLKLAVELCARYWIEGEGFLNVIRGGLLLTGSVSKGTSE